MTRAAGEEQAGRTPGRSSSSYLFPRHPREINRLDLQHDALREAMGSDCLAPLERPERILDVGTGTGQWCLDMVARFPHVVAVGLDLVLGKPLRDHRYGFVRGDVTGGRPGSFLASVWRAMFTRPAPAFEGRCSLPQVRTLELIRRSLLEIAESRSSAVFVCVWGAPDDRRRSEPVDRALGVRQRRVASEPAMREGVE